MIDASGTLDVTVYTDLVPAEIEHGRIEVLIETPEDNRYTVDNEQEFNCHHDKR